MANYATLKAAIIAAIKQNGNNEITGNLLQQQLLAMVNSLGVGYQYIGIATPDTNPGTPDQNVFYIASTAGTYTNFGGLVLANGEIAILKYNGEWSKELTGAATTENIERLAQEILEDANEIFSRVIEEANEILSSAIKEVELQSVTEQDVAGYLVDTRGVILARLMKDGAIERTQPNSADVKIANIEDFLTYVSSEIPDGGNGVVKYLVDLDGKIIASIDNTGNIKINAGGGFCGENTTDKFVNLDAVKILTDSNNNIIGWITTGGKVHLVEAEIDNLKVSNTDELGVPDTLWYLLSVLANGTENHKLVTDRTITILKALPNSFFRKGIGTIDTIPMMSFQDDDAFERQLPQSYIYEATEETEPIAGMSKYGGFMSILFPIMKALNLKHKDEISGKLTIGSCAEGQRTGLTKLYGMNDEFDGQLNTSGLALKKLVEKEGWEVLCHGMTARYIENSYLVNGLDSEFANSLLVDAVYDGNNGLGWRTTTCYDTITKKNYKVKEDKSGWDECPVHYAKPYLALTKASDSPLVLNPTYSVEYQVKTWQDRARVAGLPFINCLVGWGNSHSSWHVLEDQKYIDHTINKSTNETNTVPYYVSPTRNAFIMTPPAGTPGNTENYNVYNRADWEKYKSYIDNCVNNKGWSIFRLHAYETRFYNGYFDDFADLYGVDSEYCGPLGYKDDNYPSEWIVPLNHDEIIDMIGNNVHDYWNVPPARLNISTWDEWYPCPGTAMAMWYDLIEYAILQGVTFVNTKYALDKYGNIVGIGCNTASKPFQAENRLPESVRVNWWCKISADGAISIEKNN